MASEEFDFDRSVEQAWRRFAVRLAEVLSMMDETEPLTLQSSEAAGEWLVRFSQETRNIITARVAGAVRGTPLTPAQGKQLAAWGWQATPAGFEITSDQDHCGPLADAVVQVLRQVFSVEHPVFLDSNVLTEILQEPPASPIIGGAGGTYEETLAYTLTDEVQLAAAVSEELSVIFGTAPLRDQDGDFAVRVGSTMIFVRIPSDAKEVRLFSVLVHDVSGRSRAAEVLNDVNAHARWVRFSLVRDKIIATMSLWAAPFVPAHLRQAITEMANVSDGVDDLLASSLQGKTTFEVEQ